MRMAETGGSSCAKGCSHSNMPALPHRHARCLINAICRIIYNVEKLRNASKQSVGMQWWLVLGSKRKVVIFA
jgi:hypothetical protein